MVSLIALSVLALAGKVAADTVTYDWEVASEVISPDGFPRSAALVNGCFPGPVITAKKGDRVTVNVKNHLTDPTMRRSTSIHWHGIFQDGNAYNDGPSFVTQCPIAPGHSYPYTLVLGQQTGTFWYHSHLSTQYVDGIRGAIVIYDPDDTLKHMYDVDDENTIITLADWYHPAAMGAAAAWFAGGKEPVPDSGLINGVGRYAGGPKVPWARINVKHGLRYRFRLVSLSAEGEFEFAISKHSMTVIESDGITIKPYTVNSIPVLAGQRYSVVVTANQDVGNYWIQATQTVLGVTKSSSNANFNGNLTYAVLHYEGAAHTDPRAPRRVRHPRDGVRFKEYKMKPLGDPGLPGGAHPSNLHVFNFTFNTTTKNADVWTINGIQYKSPSVPTLLNVLAHGHANPSQFGKHEHTFILPRNQIVEIAFIGGPGHPFHLHGHAFYVVQSASGGPPNYVDPPRRDVVSSGGTVKNPVRIRFLTDNPGPWFLHCHINWHLAAGLAAVFVEDPKGIENGPKSIRPNDEWNRLCKIYSALDHSLQ